MTTRFMVYDQGHPPAILTEERDGYTTRFVWVGSQDASRGANGHFPYIRRERVAREVSAEVFEDFWRIAK